MPLKFHTKCRLIFPFIMQSGFERFIQKIYARYCIFKGDLFCFADEKDGNHAKTFILLRTYSYFFHGKVLVNQVNCKSFYLQSAFFFFETLQLSLLYRRM